MKIIDDKGRIFGKINIIDLLVLLVIIGIVGMFVFSYVKFIENSRPKKAEVKETTSLEIDFKLIRVSPEVVSLLKVGDKQLDSNGKAIGEITWIGEPKPYQYIFNMGSGPGVRVGFLVKEDEYFKEIPVKIKLHAEVRELSGAYYNNQQLLFNTPVTFSTSKYSLLAVPVVALSSAQKHQTWLQIKVKFSGLYPELSNLINQGHIEIDAEGNVIARLKEIISAKLTEVQALKVQDNTIAVINDPFRSDITAVLDVLCTKMPDGWYYKNYPVKIGSQITFSAELYQVTGTIIGLNIPEETKHD